MKPVDINAAGIIGTRQLAAILGVGVCTICRWANEDERLAKCKIRRGVFSLRDLRANGFIAQPVKP